jgi:hypothetical protein
VNWFKEAWPASARVKFCVGAKQLIIATSAAVNPIIFAIGVLAGKWRLGILHPAYIKLVFGEGFFPLFVVFYHAIHELIYSKSY